MRLRKISSERCEKIGFSNVEGFHLGLGMGFVNSFEHRLRWLAFPSLLRGIGIIHFVIVLALMFRPEVAGSLNFDWEKIVSGEVWRVVSFLFLVVPGGLPFMGTIGTLLVAYFALRITFLFNDALENSWGVFRTSCYIYASVLGQIIANCVLAQLGPQYTVGAGGGFLYMAAFFAFATLFPKHSFLLFLIIPIHVYVLAILSGALLILNALGSPTFGLFVLLTFAPYLWWAIPLARNYSKNRGQIAKRRVDFQSKSKPGVVESFHCCKTCGATELSHPDRDFRVTSDGDEICSDCLS